MNDWPGRGKAETLRQWPTLKGTINRAAEIDAIDGVVILGSFASGDADELSDLDLVVVTAPGRFREAWVARHRLAGDALVTWEEGDYDPTDVTWFKWLTRDLVKVDCGIVDASRGRAHVVPPLAVVVGDASLAGRLPRVTRATAEEREALRYGSPRDFDPAELSPGERLGWTIAQMRAAARDAIRASGQQESRWPDGRHG